MKTDISCLSPLVCVLAALCIPASRSAAAPAENVPAAAAVPAASRWLGVRPEQAPGGLTVLEVFAYSPAEKAGVRVGDVLLKFDDQKLETPQQLQTLVDKQPIGKAVKLTLLRDEKEEVLEVPNLSADVFIRPKGVLEDQKTPLLVFLHGMGDRPGGLARTLAPITEKLHCSLFLPCGTAKQAPIRYDGRQGYNWWIGPNNELAPKIAQLKGIDAKHIYAGGFSIGFAKGCMLAVQNPDLFAGAIVFSGHFVPSPSMEDTVRKASRKVPFYLVAGTRDSWGFNGAKETWQYLMDHDFRVKFRSWGGGHQLPPDCLDTIQEAVRWFDAPRNPGLECLYGLRRADKILAGSAPASLRDSEQTMQQADDKDLVSQQQALDAYRSGISRVVADVSSSAARPDDKDAALQALAGLSLKQEFRPGAKAGEAVIATILRGPAVDTATGTLTISDDSMTEKAPAAEAVELSADKPVEARRVVQVGSWTPRIISAVADLVWCGKPIHLRSYTSGCTTVPRWYVIGPFANPGGAKAATKTAVESDAFAPTNAYTGFSGAPVGWQKCVYSPEQNIFDDFVVNLGSLYGKLHKAQAYARTVVVSPIETDALLGIGSDDGVVVWLNGQKVFTKLGVRGYQAMSDRVPIYLNAGANELLICVTQESGDWMLGARILDSQGRPLKGLSYPLEKQ